MNPKIKLLACVLGLMAVVQHCTVSAADVIVHSSGRIIIHTNVSVNAGSFTVESGGAIDMDLTARVTATNFNYGGTLTVIPTGAALSLGESFQLFSAPTYSGSFPTLNLPSLDMGLSWISGLGVNGRLYIVEPSQLVITGIARQDAAMQMQFLGAPGQNYNVLGTTNPALPLAKWSVLGMATESSPGQFQFKDTSFTNFVLRFYQIQ